MLFQKIIFDKFFIEKLSLNPTNTMNYIINYGTMRIFCRHKSFGLCQQPRKD